MVRRFGGRVAGRWLASGADNRRRTFHGQGPNGVQTDTNAASPAASVPTGEALHGTQDERGQDASQFAE